VLASFLINNHASLPSFSWSWSGDVKLPLSVDINRLSCLYILISC